jgi:DNA-binding transcriptional MerR regulator/methylmalonyl-CoA mutase cobalamin-binding subunit
MYTIKEAAARTGLTVPVLRAWERRYGVVSPTRTPGGYRVYDEAALGRLRAMRRLIDDGWTASAAAAAVVAGTVESVAAAEQPRSRPRGRGVDVDVEHRLVDAAATLDSPRIESALDDMFASGSYERVVEDHVLPALRALGDAWASGRLPVAGEHVASNAIQRRLAAAFQASGPGPAAVRPVLVGMPPGARHELGGLIFATAARRAGLRIVYLGADLPLADWVAAVERTNARGVVIGALMNADGAAARSVASGLRAANPDLVIAFGGCRGSRPGCGPVHGRCRTDHPAPRRPHGGRRRASGCARGGLSLLTQPAPRATPAARRDRHGLPLGTDPPPTSRRR